MCAVLVGCGGTSADDSIALSDLSVTTAQDTPVTVTIPVTASRPQEVALSAHSGPSHGSISANGTRWTYTPATHFNGTDEVVVEAQDASGAQASATLTITVTPAEAGPHAVDDNGGATPGGPITIEQSWLLHNDWEQGSGSLHVVSVQDGIHGVAVIQGTNVVFTPETDCAGPASFTYTISDGHLTATATVSIACLPPAKHAAPIAGDDSIGVVGAAKIESDTFVLLDNDKDPDGYPLRITSVSDASVDSFVAAKITLGSDQLEIEPVDGYSGAAQFTYRVSDGFNETQASVKLFISPWPRSGDVSVRMHSEPTKDVGDTRTYEIAVTGPANEFVYVDVSDPIPDGLTCTWTCTGEHRGDCAASGSGSIKATVRLHGALRYELTCTVSGSTTITNAVTVTPPGWSLFTDTDVSNNTDSVSR